MRISEGKPYPLGATADAEGTNFAVFSAHATRVEVCIFDSDRRPRNQTASNSPSTPTRFSTAMSPKSGPGTFYGFRVHGPLRARSGPPIQSEQASARPLCPRACGQADVGPRRIRLHDRRRGRRPHAWTSATARPSCPSPSSSIRISTGGANIAGAACPGTTRSSTKPTSKGSPSSIPRSTRSCRGFYAGLGSKPVVDYIRSLGVTTVELMPVHTFIDDSYLLEKGLKNYWGYNSIGFFAPDPRYAADVPNSLREFKEMIARLHDGGLEVILDVVYNHTAEGNELRPDAVLQGHRQQVLLPAAARQAALLHQRHRHRKHAQSQPSARHPDGGGQPALLGERDARRRLPLRSRHDPRPRARRLQDRERLSESGRAGSAAGGGQADRRALGLRSGRLSGRRLSARAGPNGTTPSATPRATSGGARRARRRLRRGFARRPTSSIFAAENLGRASISSSPTTASRCATSSPTTTSTTRRTARTTATAIPTIARWNCGAEGPTEDPEIRGAAPAADAQFSRNAPALAGHADGVRRRRVRPHSEWQQQRLLPGQRDQLGRLEDWTRSSWPLVEFLPPPHGGCSISIRSCAAPGSSPAR